MITATVLGAVALCLIAVTLGLIAGVLFSRGR